MWTLLFLLVSASLSCSFRLLLSSYGRFFVKFLLSQIADDAVSRAFSLKTTKCAFHAFVFSDFNRRHSFSPSFADAFIEYFVIIAIPTFYVKSFFAVFTTFLRFFPYFLIRRKNICRLLSAGEFLCRFYIGSKSDAGCLHQGQIKSSGNSSPSWTYPQILQTHFFVFVSASSCFACGLGLILL